MNIQALPDNADASEEELLQHLLEIKNTVDRLWEMAPPIPQPYGEPGVDPAWTAPESST